jgi:predicted Zn-dependent protease
MVTRAAETKDMGYDVRLFEPIWNVARAEILIAQGDLPRAEGYLRDSVARLEPAYGSIPEYFLAAERLADVLSKTGREGEARTVLERANSKRGRAFGRSLLFWVVCARQLERQLKGQGDHRAAAAIGLDLSKVLAAADGPPAGVFAASSEPTPDPLLTVR